MKKIYVLLMLCLSVGIQVKAQVSGKIPVAPAVNPGMLKGKQHLVSFDLHVPVGGFARSHIAGVGLNYSWSNHRYGILYPRKGIGFTANAGVDYYLGKKREIAEYDFTYGGYTYLYAQAGIIANPVKKGIITLTAGPATGIYKRSSDFGWGVNLFGAYYLKNTHLLVGPGVTYKKYKEADALWTVAVRVSYCF